jgi:hypothetical protein
MTSHTTSSSVPVTTSLAVSSRAGGGDLQPSPRDLQPSPLGTVLQLATSLATDAVVVQRRRNPQRGLVTYAGSPSAVFHHLAPSCPKLRTSRAIGFP